MRVMKASAGSGKTFNLAKTYIDLLLKARDRYAYRHILAVTFTNKATGEMKSRILKDLAELAKTDSRAESLLVDILHDYSAFSISTIDKFFQQTLKSFSREIGQFADYQIELDRDALIAESMDRILDLLTEEKTDLIKWLKSSMSDKLESGRRFSLDEGLYETGSMLKSEEHRELVEKLGINDVDEYSKERLEKVRKECRRLISDFEGKAAAAGLSIKPGEKIRKPGVKAMKADPGLAELFDTPYREYNTARIIYKLIFSLGLAGEFYKEFSSLLKEKNLMCLDESNTILRDIIDGSDAPFVYEKLGVRYEHFLLDEFQDTSNIQWENFLPLLRESESHIDPRRDGDNLIVGDVKQSIYRFRDSDWKLLGSVVGKEFPDARVEVLENNWRSTAEVVRFNNGFFTMAAERLGLSDIYSDVRQHVRSDDSQTGYVRVSFCEDQMQAVLDSIAEARAAGALWGDIAVLVRNRKHGSEVAASLISSDIPVISDDSLSLKSSIVVRRLVSLLSCLDNPEDRIGRYLADLMGMDFPDEYHSLPDLCECMLRSLKEYDPESFEGESLFINAFMDDILSWTEVNGNNLRYYLKHWEESDPYVGSPENAASVRILTIHKSKGLEFPYVIFPYADKVGLYRNGVHWCRLNAAGTGLSDIVSGIYPVELGPSSEDTLFAAEYREERLRQAVDNINLFYVALTRAGKGLHIIAKEPSKKCRESIRKGKAEYGNFSEILFEYCGSADDRVYGEMYDFSRMKRKTLTGESDFPASYSSIPIDGRLRPSEEAYDFFGADGTVGAEASARRYGIVLHDILSRVRTIADLEKAVSGAVRDGRLPDSEEAGVLAMLSGRISSRAGWFNGGVIHNELTVYDSYGREYRPDRVIIRDTETVVVDFKFGVEEESHLKQISRYVSLYRKMGYPEVKGFLWYVQQDKVVPAE